MAPTARGVLDELPLITFTTCIPASIGTGAVALAFGASLPFGLCCLFLTGIGAVASVAHLAKPHRAPTSLRHWDGSWLSREILIVSAYAACVFAWCVFAYLGKLELTFLFAGICLLVGSVLLYAISKAYRVGPRPAWNGSESLVELWGATLGSGSTLGALVATCTISIVPVWVVLLMCIGIALESLARNKRISRLGDNGSRRAEASIENAIKMRETIRCSSTLEIASAALVLPASLSEGVSSVILVAIAVVMQLTAHFFQRAYFYSLPEPIMHCPKLRKN